MTDQIKNQIDRHLILFLEKRKKTYPFRSVHPILFKSIKDFCSRKGKRIRPLLMALSYKGYTKRKKISNTKLYTSCGCLELLHNFMLIHDDIIDNSDLRRGKPTLHKILAKTVKTKQHEKLGTDLAIVAGDIVYALSIDAFLAIDEDPNRKEKALRYLIQTAGFTAMGEFIDIIHGFEDIRKIKEKDVFLNYALKTARYTFECPLTIGAILANAPQKDIKKLSRLGALMGQAFQIQDDIIGIFSKEKKIGKSILSDLDEDKKTILVCHAYKILTKSKKQAFVKILKKSKKTHTDLINVQKIFIKSGSLAYSLIKIQKILKESQNILNGLSLKPAFKKQIWSALSILFKQSKQIADSYHIFFKNYNEA
ncbi:MAG: polyprenyl synthetase family protein [Candidatus Aceula meridiana]|nr:polyprenyl synthetase family protein [Candidatus Aceula meridiana]